MVTGVKTAYRRAVRGALIEQLGEELVYPAGGGAAPAASPDGKSGEMLAYCVVPARVTRHEVQDEVAGLLSGTVDGVCVPFTDGAASGTLSCRIVEDHTKRVRY